jgi:DnaJ-class molecular chaperone
LARSQKSKSDKVREMYERPRTDPYEVLGVGKSATQDEIKTAYREKALEHHPDRNQETAKDAEKRFKEVVEAYDVLSDEFKRTYFDKHGVEGGRRKERTPPSPATEYKKSSHYSYSQSPFEEHYSRRSRDDDPPRNIYVGDYNGTAHYHLGHCDSCAVCGIKT